MGQIDINLLKKMYELVYTIRRFEQRAIEQYRLGNIRGYFHPYLGEEAIAVGGILALEPDDYIVSTHRGHGHAIAKGHGLKLMMAEIFGKVTGYCKGRGGSMHVSNLTQHNLGANGIVGGGIPIATGAAMGIKQKGTSQVILSFFSDGAAGNGVFHESLNMAAIFKLPVIFMLENNHYAVSTPVEYSTLVPDLSCRGACYGMPAFSIDGNDAVTIYETMKEPIERARKGEGPTLIEFKTYRHGGHHVNDPGLYIPKDTLDAWKARDPLDLLKSHLVQRGFSESKIKEINEKVDDLIEEAIRFAIGSPEPSVEEFLSEVRNT